MVTHLVWETWRALRLGHFAAAARNLWTAVRLYPFATLRRVFTPTNARFVRKTLTKPIANFKFEA